MGIDTLALLVAKSPQRVRTEGLIMKELGVTAASQQKTISLTKDN